MDAAGDEAIDRLVVPIEDRPKASASPPPGLRDEPFQRLVVSGHNDGPTAGVRRFGARQRHGDAFPSAAEGQLTETGLSRCPYASSQAACERRREMRIRTCGDVAAAELPDSARRWRPTDTSRWRPGAAPRIDLQGRARLDERRATAARRAPGRRRGRRGSRVDTGSASRSRDGRACRTGRCAPSRGPRRSTARRCPASGRPADPRATRSSGIGGIGPCAPSR